MYRIGGRQRDCYVSIRGAAVGIPPLMILNSNEERKVHRQCQAGSLTGAVASQRVTEAPKGAFSLDGNQILSVKG